MQITTIPCLSYLRRRIKYDFFSALFSILSFLFSFLRLILDGFCIVCVTLNGMIEIHQSIPKFSFQQIHFVRRKYFLILLFFLLLLFSSYLLSFHLSFLFPHLCPFLPLLLFLPSPSSVISFFTFLPLFICTFLCFFLILVSLTYSNAAIVHKHSSSPPILP